MTWQTLRPAAKELSIATICLVIALAGAFLAASFTSDKNIFQLAHPQGGEPDTFPVGQRLDLHRTFFTAWAALILVTPALCTFLFRRNSESAARYWLAFWTVSFLAFLVHFYWAVVVLFGNDWHRIFQAHARVSAPIPDTIVMVWWGVDVMLAWLMQSEKTWVRVQRMVVHLAVLVLFFLGSALQGELVWSRAIGYAMGAAVLASVIYWFILKTRTPTLGRAQSA